LLLQIIIVPILLLQRLVRAVLSQARCPFVVALLLVLAALAVSSLAPVGHG
jgi:hypothetical protein